MEGTPVAGHFLAEINTSPAGNEGNGMATRRRFSKGRRGLLYGYAFGKVAGLVNMATPQHGDIVGQ